MAEKLIISGDSKAEKYEVLYKQIKELVGYETDEIANMADTYIKIPMCGQVESLNAAISASLLMYETNRQRRNTEKKNARG